MNIPLLQSVGWAESTSYNQPAWSISVELWLGSLIVLACFINTRVAAALITLVSLVLIVIEKPDMNLGGQVLPIGIAIGNLRCLFSMGLGILAYDLLKNHELPVSIDIALCVGGGLALAGTLLSAPNPNTTQYIIVMLLVTVAIARVPACPQINHLLDGEIFKTLGQLSYSIYLLHVPVVMVVIHYLGQGPTSTVHMSVGCTVILAWFTFRYIEAPAIKLGHRMVGKNTKSAYPRDVPAMATGVGDLKAPLSGELQKADV